MENIHTHEFDTENVVISLQNVSKSYKRYAHPMDRLKEVFFPRRSLESDFKPLKNISFEITAGQTVGIIGDNGAGKSTLLKMIGGLLSPSEGKLQVKGQVTPLLELGTGFHGDFTGRENVYLNASMLGLSREETNQRFKAIADFADIGDFIDQPVKTYSTGMYLRLAFSAAISVKPDILLLDEIFAVGDIHFQQKCCQRMQELSQSGVTLVFVSHDMSSISRLCRKTILLDRGNIVAFGDTKTVLTLYEKNFLEKREGAETTLTSHVSENAITCDEQRLQACRKGESHATELRSADVSVGWLELRDINNRILTSAVSGERVRLSLGLIFHQALSDPHAAFQIRDKTGYLVYLTTTIWMQHFIGPVTAASTVVVHFDFTARLIAGLYTIDIGIANGRESDLVCKETKGYFPNAAVLDIRSNTLEPFWHGFVNLNSTVSSSTYDDK